MSKYYVKCGSLELIYSTSKTPFDAAVTVLWEANNNDTLDEYFYIDERGMKDYTTADKRTTVIDSGSILDSAGWEKS
jgi:hypothetical protein